METGTEKTNLSVAYCVLWKQRQRYAPSLLLYLDMLSKHQAFALKKIAIELKPKHPGDFDFLNDFLVETQISAALDT